MARMSSNTKQTVIGAATCLAIALFFVVGYSGDPRKRDSDGYNLYGTYEDADGIRPGSPVLMAGIRIGTVGMLRLDTDTNQAIVQMTIDNRFEIPIDSEATIISDGLAGGKYIRVVPGGDLTVMAPDEEFDYTRSSVNFFELFERIILMAEARRGQSAENEQADDTGTN